MLEMSIDLCQHFLSSLPTCGWCAVYNVLMWGVNSTVPNMRDIWNFYSPEMVD